MSRTKRRHKIGFGYIGSGNNHNVFSRKPRLAFSEIKDKLNTKSYDKYQLEFNDRRISQKDRINIKNNIKSETRNRTLKAILITLLLLIALVYIAIQMIEGALFRH